jgi:UDP-GlcNAc:undecaprenyl-phosphate GlcNAc-1-phosphate transferase
MTKLDAVYAFGLALLVSALATPLAARFAFRIGAVDHPRERGLSTRETPRLGGLAIFLAVLAAASLSLIDDPKMRAVLGGGALIVAVGAIDDAREQGLAPLVKLIGQIGAAVIPVLAGISVSSIRLPFIGVVNFGEAGGPLTVLGLVAMMNVVNFSDGVDGLAAGVCAISAITLSVIAFDFADDSVGAAASQHAQAAVLAALTAGAALGFLIHNFHPASVFMGDSGANLLGLLLGAVAVQGEVKTASVVALLFPLVILAVPFLDTGFVVAKRIKYRQPVYGADASHFHHRLANIGFSQRRTVLYLYGWTLALAGLALAIRFLPWSDHHGHFSDAWIAVLVAFALAVLALSVYLVIVLEILKFRIGRSGELRRTLGPETSEHEIAAVVARELETGEIDALGDGAPQGDGAPRPDPHAPPAGEPRVARARPSVAESDYAPGPPAPRP